MLVTWTARLHRVVHNYIGLLKRVGPSTVSFLPCEPIRRRLVMVFSLLRSWKYTKVGSAIYRTKERPKFNDGHKETLVSSGDVTRTVDPFPDQPHKAKAISDHSKMSLMQMNELRTQMLSTSISSRLPDTQEIQNDWQDIINVSPFLSRMAITDPGHGVRRST